MSDSLPSDAPRPRLCHLRKWPDFNGYGFNLHAERGKAGQFIGTVDAQSPSVVANLRPGDRIVEVNGTNIGSENHQQVVQRIKAVPDETTLLVVDEETDNYYKELKVVVRGDMENVHVCETPMTNPFTNPTTESDALIDAVKISDTGDNDDVIEQTETSHAAADAGDCVVRLCHLKIWPDFAGYGFNLHADRATPGQYVGKVDERSPAEAAGLKLNDRIVEVNGSSVDGKSHADVVMEIKSVAGEVRLLVVDAAADEFYRNAGVNISSSTVTDIQTIVCPDTGPHFSTVNGEQEAATSLAEAEREDIKVEAAGVSDDNKLDIDSSAVSLQSTQHEIIGDDVDDDTSQQHQHSAVVEDVSEAASSQEHTAAASDSGSLPAPAVSVPDVAPTGRQPVVVGGIEFAASAKEARERMKKKSSVKQDTTLSLRDKYELLQKL